MGNDKLKEKSNYQKNNIKIYLKNKIKIKGDKNNYSLRKN